MADTGRWTVATRDSTHDFDLDAGTVTRIPRYSAAPGPNDQTWSLRSIKQCVAGLPGKWTMHWDGLTHNVDFHWHYSSIIQRISRHRSTTEQL
jgi:hypothetical protein